MTTSTPSQLFVTEVVQHLRHPLCAQALMSVRGETIIKINVMFGGRGDGGKRETSKKTMFVMRRLLSYNKRTLVSDDMAHKSPKTNKKLGHLSDHCLFIGGRKFWSLQRFASH